MFATIDLNKLHDEDYLELALKKQLPDNSRDEDLSNNPKTQSELRMIPKGLPSTPSKDLFYRGSASPPKQTMACTPPALIVPEVHATVHYNSEMMDITQEVTFEDEMDQESTKPASVLMPIALNTCLPHNQPQHQIVPSTSSMITEDDQRPSVATSTGVHFEVEFIQSLAMDGVESTIAPSPMDDVRQTTTTPTWKLDINAENVLSHHQDTNQTMVDAPEEQRNPQSESVALRPSILAGVGEARVRKVVPTDLNLDVKFSKANNPTAIKFIHNTSDPSLAFTPHKFETIPAQPSIISEPFSIGCKHQEPTKPSSPEPKSIASTPAASNLALKVSPPATSCAFDAASKADTRSASKNGTHEEMIKLLIEARRKTLLKQDQVSIMFANMSKISFEKKQDLIEIVDYFVGHPCFGGGLKDFKKAFDIIQQHVDDDRTWTSEYIVWVCNEALMAKTLRVRNMELSRIPGNKRIGYIQRLLSRIVRANFELMKEVNGEGCLTWPEMVKLAEDEESQYFDERSTRDHLPTYRSKMQSLNGFWNVSANMKKLISDRLAKQDGPVGQDGASAPANCSEKLVAQKRKNSEVKHGGESTCLIISPS